MARIDYVFFLGENPFGHYREILDKLQKFVAIQRYYWNLTHPRPSTNKGIHKSRGRYG